MRRVLIAAGLLALASAGPLGADDAVRTAQDAARVAQVTRSTDDFTAPETYEANAGGAGTASATGSQAFRHPPANLSRAGELDFLAGRGMFAKIWVAAPTATSASDGLGPYYNARSCLSCHPNNGRGHPGEGSVSAVLHLATPDSSEAGDPVYGRQMQTFATIGLVPEGRLAVTWEEHTGKLAGGETAALRKPAPQVTALAFGPLAPETRTSLRVAPPLIGLGLLEAIPAADIRAREDPGDSDGDGISGRANMVWSVALNRPALGRFGLKAGQATVRDQTALAFATDIGISTPLYRAGWGDCTAAEADCRAAPHGDGDARGVEADAEALAAAAFYAANLAVPARRDVGEPQVLAGKALFYGAGCTACHTPKYVTARLPGQPERSFQLVWPYSDLLLHDMGPGLADGFTEGRATGAEWRTPPLWGLGLTPAVSGETTYLHDGRARSLTEAILWHGGEATPARDRFAAMPAPGRDALITFLESL